MLNPGDVRGVYEVRNVPNTYHLEFFDKMDEVINAINAKDPEIFMSAVPRRPYTFIYVPLDSPLVDKVDFEEAQALITGVVPVSLREFIDSPLPEQRRAIIDLSLA